MERTNKQLDKMTEYVCKEIIGQKMKEHSMDYSSTYALPIVVLILVGALLYYFFAPVLSNKKPSTIIYHAKCMEIVKDADKCELIFKGYGKE